MYAPTLITLPALASLGILIVTEFLVAFFINSPVLPVATDWLGTSLNVFPVLICASVFQPTILHVAFFGAILFTFKVKVCSLLLGDGFLTVCSFANAIDVAF